LAALPAVRTALRVLGVMVAPVADELIMLRKAVVLGDGGGRHTNKRGETRARGQPCTGSKASAEARRVKREWSVTVCLLGTRKHGRREGPSP
jgi:hypothetical protein